MCASGECSGYAHDTPCSIWCEVKVHHCSCSSSHEVSLYISDLSLSSLNNFLQEWDILKLFLSSKSLLSICHKIFWSRVLNILVIDSEVILVIALFYTKSSCVCSGDSLLSNHVVVFLKHVTEVLECTISLTECKYRSTCSLCKV